MVSETLIDDRIETGSGVDGLDFDADNETWTIPQGLMVFSETSYGVFSHGFANNTLVNDGRIYTAAEVAGVRLNDGDGSVVNGAGAEIFGARNGIDFQGSGNQSLNNHGTIIGADNNGVFFGGDATGVTVTNHGYIFGGAFGVENASDFVGGTIHNFGTIEADSITTDSPYPAAISLYSGSTLVTQITNEAHAVIKGAVDAIYANSGLFHLTNHGTIIGDIFDADGGSDVIVNTGNIKGEVFLEGDSTFKGAGGHSGAIHVGGGNDTITGGSGADHFVFDSALTGQIEKITNFQHGVDKIVLSEDDFPNVGPADGTLASDEFSAHATAVTPDQHILYDRSDGFLYYDNDGSGTADAPIHFATLANHPALSHVDFLVDA